jgi:hypothetical protein
VSARLVRTLLGVVAVLIATAFLAVQVYTQRRQLLSMDLPPGIWWKVLALSIVHLAGLVMLAVAWGVCLRASGAPSARWKAILRVYGLANLLKYLPGNVFHFAGRQLMGLQRGWPQSSILAATLIELALHLIVACTLILVLLTPRLLGIWAPAAISQYLAVGLVVAWLAVLVAVVVFLHHKAARLRAALPPARRIAFATCLQAVFFTAVCFMAAALAEGFEFSVHGRTASLVAGGYLLAWLAGFIVPGAPGGLAVREATLLVIAPYLGLQGDAALLAFAIGMRLVTTLGDIWAGVAAAFLVPRRIP